MERRVMSLSRRLFTKEFKEAAVRRLELGASIAEVARACEVNANVLHRWKRELREYGPKAFAGNGKSRAEENHGESAQMTPVDAGPVAAIELSQVPTDGGSQSWFQGRAADMNPGLAMPRAGLHHDTRFMPVSPHRRQHRGIGVIQVDQDVTGVSVRSIRMDIDIASFAVADPQKANGGEVCQLRRRPQAFSGKRPFGCVVDQTNEVKLTGHRRQLSADGPRGKREAEVKHAPDSATEWGCRTMNSQRVVNSVLTRCLSQGAHFTTLRSTRPLDTSTVNSVHFAPERLKA